MTNVWKTIDELIAKRYRVPYYRPVKFSVEDTHELPTMDDSTVEIGALLYQLKADWIRKTKKVEEYERVLKAYAAKPKRTVYINSPGYDPQSGFRDFSTTLEYDDYKEAREVFLKWNPVEDREGNDEASR